MASPTTPRNGRLRPPMDLVVGDTPSEDYGCKCDLQWTSRLSTRSTWLEGVSWPSQPWTAPQSGRAREAPSPTWRRLTARPLRTGVGLRCAEPDLDHRQKSSPRCTCDEAAQSAGRAGLSWVIPGLTPVADQSIRQRTAIDPSGPCSREDLYANRRGACAVPMCVDVWHGRKVRMLASVVTWRQAPVIRT